MATRDPITRQPAYLMAWLLLVAAFAVSLFGPLWAAGILFVGCPVAYGVAWRRVHRPGANRDAPKLPPQ